MSNKVYSPEFKYRVIIPYKQREGMSNICSKFKVSDYMVYIWLDMSRVGRCIDMV